MKDLWFKVVSVCKSGWILFIVALLLGCYLFLSCILFSVNKVSYNENKKHSKITLGVFGVGP